MTNRHQVPDPLINKRCAPIHWSIQWWYRNVLDGIPSQNKGGSVDSIRANRNGRSHAFSLVWGLWVRLCFCSAPIVVTPWPNRYYCHVTDLSDYVYKWIGISRYITQVWKDWKNHSNYPYCPIHTFYLSVKYFQGSCRFSFLTGISSSQLIRCWYRKPFLINRLRERNP